MTRAGADDPWEKLRRLGPSSSLVSIVPWVAIALLAHTGAIASPNMTMLPMRQHVRTMRVQLDDYFGGTIDIDVDPQKEDKPPAKSEPQPEPEPEPEDPKSPPTPPPPTRANQEAPKAKEDDYGEARPAAAEAAAILNSGEAKGEDLTEFTMPHKDGSTATPSGWTSSEGTAKTPVRDPRADAKGKEGARGNGDGDGNGPQKRVDRSRPAMPVSTSLSDCPFPPQADMAQIDNAVVEVTVSVDPHGRATQASVRADPGYGFGGQARRCALAMRYQPALNPNGDAIAGSTPTLRFRFNR
jgi:protein TonB